MQNHTHGIINNPYKKKHNNGKISFCKCGQLKVYSYPNCQDCENTLQYNTINFIKD